MIAIQGETCKRLDIVTGDKTLKDYYISMTGRVFSTKRKQIKEIKSRRMIENKRYMIVNLYSNSKCRIHYVHRLVAKAFVLNVKNGNQIIHKNGDLTDNRAENLIYRKEVTGYKRGEYKKKERVVYLPPLFDVSEELVNEIRLLHQATQIKGMNVPDNLNDFFYDIMKDSIEEYKIKYNLNKILYGLRNQSS
jgi:hypothetical protein